MVLNIVGIDMKKHGVPLFVPPQYASQCTLPKKLIKKYIGYTVPLFDALEILIVQLVVN